MEFYNYWWIRIKIRTWIINILNISTLYYAIQVAGNISTKVLPPDGNTVFFATLTGLLLYSILFIVTLDHATGITISNKNEWD